MNFVYNILVLPYLNSFLASSGMFQNFYERQFITKKNTALCGMLLITISLLIYASFPLQAGTSLHNRHRPPITSHPLTSDTTHDTSPKFYIYKPDPNVRIDENRFKAGLLFDVENKRI